MALVVLVSRFTGADLEKFTETMRQQIDLSVNGFITAGCQIALIVSARRLDKTVREIS